MHGYEGFPQLVVLDVGGDLGTDIKVRLRLTYNNNYSVLSASELVYTSPPRPRGTVSGHRPCLT